MAHRDPPPPRDDHARGAQPRPGVDEPEEAPEVSLGDLTSPSAWATTFTSLGEREYAWFFAGNLTFFMGMQMQFVLRGFLTYELTESAFALSLLAVTIALPMLIAAPFGGVVADRVNKRTLLIVTQSGAALSSLLVAVLILGGWIEFWHLLAISLATGVIFSFNMPARQALVPNLVPQHKLMNAISLQMGGMNLTRIIAPAVGGALIAPLGVGMVYMITLVLFIIAVASEFHLPKHGMVSDQERGTFFEDFTAGFRYILEIPLLRVLILGSLLIPLFGFPVQQILPVFAEDVFDVGPTGLGLLFAAGGTGGLIGAMFSANMDRIPAKGRLMLGGGVLMGIFLIAFALVGNFTLALIFLGISNLGQMLFMATNNTMIQSGLPQEIRGRVMAVMMMSFGLMPLGVLPIGAATDVIGAPLSIAISSMLLLVALAVVFTISSTLRNLRSEAGLRMELSPVQAAALVAEGKLTQEEADRLTGRVAYSRRPSGNGASRTEPPPDSPRPGETEAKDRSGHAAGG